MRHPKELSLTSATLEDAEAIAEIVRSSYSNEPPSRVPADMPIYHADYHAEAMRDPTTRWRLMCDTAGPVGIVMWRMLPELAHLHLLFVRADRQGRGYGSLLLKHFEESACDEQPNTKLLTLHCLACSTKALRFYRRHGYHQYEPGMEGRQPELYLWIDASRREDTAWPLKKDKLLFFKLTR